MRENCTSGSVWGAPGNGRSYHRGLRRNTHMEIVLARHGKPKLRHWDWITPRQMREWIQIYNVRADSITDGFKAKKDDGRTLKITDALRAI
jgi:hypothetical protein